MLSAALPNAALSQTLDPKLRPCNFQKLTHLATVRLSHPMSSATCHPTIRAPVRERSDQG